MGLPSRVVSNTLVQFISPATRLVVGLFLAAVLSRYLGVTNFGQYAIALAYSAIFSGVIGQSGLGTVCLREIAMRPESRHSVIWETAGLQGALAALSYLVLLASLPLTSYPLTVKTAIAIFGLTVLLLPIDILALVFQADLRLSRIVAPSVIGTLTYALLTIATVVTRQGVVVLVCAALVGILVQYALILTRTWPLVKPIAAPRARLWARLASEAWPLGMNSTVTTIHQQVPMLAVSFVSLHQAGLFGAAGRIPQQLSLVPIIVQNTFFPLLVERWSADRPGFRRLTERLIAGGVIVAIPILILGAASAQWIVVTLFGESFSSASLTFVLLTAMYCLLFPGILASEALIAAGFSRINFWIAITSLPVLGLLLAALIPIAGAAGAAMAVLCTIVAMLIGVVLVTYRLLRISYGRSLLAGSAGLVVGGLTALAIAPFGSVAGGVAGAGTSLLVMFALIPSARRDASRLWEIVGRSSLAGFTR